MSDKVREAFERNVHLRWHPDAKGPGLLDRDPADGYYNTAVEYAWRVWQASRAAALEESAEVCEAQIADTARERSVRAKCAAAIRALAGRGA